MKFSAYLKSVILASLILFGFAAKSQSSTGTFGLNIHAGITAAQVQGDGLSGFNKLGFMGGLGVTTTFSDKWSGAFELNLIQKGSIKRPDAEAGDYTRYSLLLNYIQVPLYAKYNVSSKLNFMAGPAIGFLIESKEEDMDGVITGTPEFEKLELSGMLGAGYAFSERWGAEIRLEQSLIPIRSKGSYSSNTLKGRQYSTVLGILISYSIR